MDSVQSVRKAVDNMVDDIFLVEDFVVPCFPFSCVVSVSSFPHPVCPCVSV